MKLVTIDHRCRISYKRNSKSALKNGQIGHLLEIDRKLSYEEFLKENACDVTRVNVVNNSNTDHAYNLTRKLLEYDLQSIVN